MAGFSPRDPADVRERLTTWLAGRLPDAGTVTEVDRPYAGTGFTGETLLFTAEAIRGGRWRAHRYAARLAPEAYRLDTQGSFERQYRVLRALAGRVPVPEVHGYEPDPEVLGAPFFVMDRVDGRVPPDMPPYHLDGWVAEADVAVRKRMWWGTLERLAQVHRLDHRALGLEFLDRPRYGTPGLEQRLGYYAAYLSWAYDGPQPTARAALDWLRVNRPPEPHPPGLLWGDARIGNVVFAPDGTPRALLDWESAELGAAEEDLAWFLYLDRHHSAGIGVPRLPGFPGRTETIAGYEELVGRPLENLAYYEVLSAFKFAVIMARTGQAFIDFELIPADSDFPVNNTATQLLADLLGLPAPGEEPAPHR